MTSEQAVREYNSIIEYRKSNPPADGVYTETHHVIPRSCGGEDSVDNLVVLTAQEHYRAHELLPFIYGCGDNHDSMVYAWNMMSRCDGVERRLTADEYAYLREEFVAMRSAKTKEQWQDPEYRAMQSAKMTKMMTAQWQDPEYRAKKSAKMAKMAKEQWQDPEYRAKKSAEMAKMMTEQWQDPERRAMQSAKQKELWQDPEFRAKKQVPVIAFFSDGTERIFSSVSEAAASLGICPSGISGCLTGRRKSAGGIRFHRVDKNMAAE